jgi:two-component system NarL family response regulator
VTTQVRLVVADDHALFRQGLKSLLRRRRDFQVVAEVERASDIEGTLASNPCDVLLLDLQMERWTISDIEQFSRVTRVLVLTASESLESAVSALRMGAKGIVQKRFAIQTLMEAIRAVADGLVWMPSTLQLEIAAQWSTPLTKQLTNRESDIVQLVAMGLRNAEVAEQLSIGESTVKTHLNNIFQKLGIRDRVELAVFALRQGLVPRRKGGGDSNPVRK